MQIAETERKTRRGASAHLFPRVALVTFLACVLLAAWTSALDSAASNELDQGIKRCLATFATARALSASLSLLQGTALAAQPMGVGVTFSIGQVLGPVNDLVHHFSSAMLLASASLGVQKVLLLISSWWPISFALTAVSLAWARNRFLERQSPALWRLTVVFLVIRFAIPTAAVMSGLVFTQFMKPDFDRDRASLESVALQSDARSSTVPAAQTAPSLIERMRDALSGQVQKLKTQYDTIKQSVEQLVERMVRLLVIFLMQALVVPVLVLWLLGVAAGRVPSASRERSLLAG